MANARDFIRVDSNNSRGRGMKYYKVTTHDWRSLGLRRNPTILFYAPHEWTVSPTIKKGKSDDGGIWVCVKMSGAKALAKYMKQRYNMNCRIFEVIIGETLFENSYRLKTDRVKLMKEMREW